MTVHLATISRKASKDESAFPFTVPAIRSLDALDVGTAVTFFVGENGSGKSTLLEGIAAAAKLPAVGSADMARDETLAAPPASRSSKPSIARRIAPRPPWDSRRDRCARHSPIWSGAMGWISTRTRTARASSRCFQSRFVPGGLYLLDEPEAPLSPQSQLALLAMMADMVAQEGQFIIATHSPILLAFPGARIYNFDATPVQAVAYEDLDHVRVTRDFLNAPAQYLKRIL